MVAPDYQELVEQREQQERLVRQEPPVQRVQQEQRALQVAVDLAEVLDLESVHLELVHAMTTLKLS
jgi:hypothetical protein